MEAIQQDMEPFWTKMNALRSVINTTDVDPACRGACKKAFEANACVAEQELGDVKGRDTSVAEKYRETRTKAEESSVAVQSHATRNRMLRELALLDASKPGMPLEYSGLFGRLGDLGAIEGKYNVAISTACGALNNLVVATTSGAQACVAYLPPRLFKLVKVNADKYLPAFYYALRDTLVTKDLDEASAIVYQGRRHKFRVVTLDGQLVEMSGAMSGGGEKLRKEQDSSQKNTEKNEQARKKIEEDIESAKTKIKRTREQITAMKEKALAVREKCNAIQEQVTAKERRLRKDESKYRKLKKEYDGMASAEVDLSNNLESCEEMLDENAKRHTGKQNSRLSIQLSSRIKYQCECFRE
ncbi:unnamed protein product [Peronospora effusa]|nr:unnamed protein product [Peronospora effusa]